MQKLAWMDKLKVGDKVVFVYYDHLSHMEKSCPVVLTKVGRKSVFVGNNRFSKWNGYQVKSDGRPVTSSSYLHRSPLRIVELLDEMSTGFEAERKETTEEIISLMPRIPIEQLRWFLYQARRMSR